MADDNGNHGSIQVGGRFQRIEEALIRIEDKLDLKANISDMSRLETKVGTLESRIVKLEIETTTINAVKAALESSQNNAVKLRVVMIGIVVNALIAVGGMTVQIVKALHG